VWRIGEGGEKMRKVLFVFLIFAVTSITNATVTWTISDDSLGGITVSVIDNPEEAICLALAVDSNGILSSFAKGLDAPKDSSSYGTLKDNILYWDLSYLGQGEVWGMEDIDWPGVYNDGNWLTADFAFAPGKTSATISLYQLGDPPMFLTSHVMVPEPITLSLLALGGLFIRRRK